MDKQGLRGLPLRLLVHFSIAAVAGLVKYFSTI
jgi:hypothetical protein